MMAKSALNRVCVFSASLPCPPVWPRFFHCHRGWRPTVLALSLAQLQRIGVPLSCAGLRNRLQSTPDLEGVQWYDPRTTHAESTQPSPCLQRPWSARLSRRGVVLAALRRARHRRSNLGRAETCEPHGAKKAEGRRCRPLRTVYGVGPQVSSSCRRPFEAPALRPDLGCFTRFRQRRRCAPTCLQGSLGAVKPAAQHRCAGEPIRAACTRRRRLMRDPYAPLPPLPPRCAGMSSSSPSLHPTDHAASHPISGGVLE